MGDKILVAYGSWAGSTARVAEIIGEVLREEGTAVDVLPVKEVRDLNAYRATVVGTAIRAGQLHRAALTFIKKHQGVLRQMPVAYFVVCMTMREDTEENRCKVDAYLNPAREQAPDVKPVEVGLFAGELDPSKLGLLPRLIMKAMKAEAADSLDPEAIRAWATGLRSALSAQ
jgi:menaquinone-dependent protoporphyrinogen oxidase